MQTSHNDMVKKVVAGTATKEEAGSVVGWLASSVEGQQCLSDMMDRDAYLLEEDSAQIGLLTPRESDRLFARIEKNIRSNRLHKSVLRVAAAFVPFLLLLGTGLFFASRMQLFEDVTCSELYVPKGETARLFFQDGTEVWINADTRIQYPKKFGWKTRDVYLEGEAYFQVASDRKKPFVVHAADTEVRVTGTSFNVNAYRDADKIGVVLNEGAVSFRAPRIDHPILPGQQLEYDKKSGRTVLKKLMYPSNISSWKDDFVFFYDTPLAEVLKVLERKYNVHFTVESDAALTYTYTLKTKQTAIEAVLLELQKITPVRFHLHEDHISVTL